MALSCELLHEILCHVPVKHLLRCRCVSKQWCSLIDSTYFVKKHFKTSVDRNRRGIIIPGGGTLYLADYESLHDDDVPAAVEINDPLKTLLSDARFVGSDNGLVCLCKENVFFLLNPSTRKCTMLPIAPAQFSPFFTTDLYWGFGYVNDDYKVVEFDIPSQGTIVIVYSLETNSWIQVQNVPSNRNIRHSDIWGRFAGGTVHWAARYAETNSRFIDGFDLGLEQFKEVVLPARNNFANRVNLVAFGGILCFLDYSNNSCVDVLLMNDNGEENCWFKAYSVDRGALRSCVSVKPLESLKCDQYVLLQVDNERFVWYHPENKAVRNINLHGLPTRFDSHLYTESLFQLTEEKQAAEALTLNKIEETTFKKKG